MGSRHHGSERADPIKSLKYDLYTEVVWQKCGKLVTLSSFKAVVRKGSLKYWTELLCLCFVKYSDMTAESRNNGALTSRPLLSNGSEITFPLQRIATNESLQGNKLLNTRFPWPPTGKQKNCASWWLLSRPRGSYSYKRQRITRVEAGSNTSTVTLRVVWGEEKGSLKSERVKYGRESQELRTREWLRWVGPAAIVNDRPYSRQRERPTSTNPQLSDGNKNLVASLGWVLYSKTDWPTDRRS
jgi:hypothetical protein